MIGFEQIQSVSLLNFNLLRTRRHRLLDVRRRRRHSSFLTGPSAILQREKRRLRAHFRAVLAELHGRDVSHLTITQQAARSRLLDELTRYARTGRFPRNFDFPAAPMPYFVDALGTRCAMAHLIESTGEIDLVARVAENANNAFVRELESDGAFRAWLEEHGLTAAEAARIQPSYCFVTRGEDCFCNQAFSPGGNGAIVEATVTGPVTMFKGMIRIDAVHGDTTLAMVGQELEADFNIAEMATGTSVLASVSKASPDRPLVNFELTNDGHVALRCSSDLKLTTQDAINAMMSSSCSTSLTKLDPGWGESICGSGTGDGDSGCAIAADHGFSPLVFAPVFLAAAFTARSRARRRLRK